MRNKALLAITAAFLMMAPSVGRAQQRGIELHKVIPGDSLELLAAEYYGDRAHKIYLMIENGLDHPRALVPGEKLRVPVSQEITVDEGDTLEGLAKEAMGDERRAKFLAEFNGLSLAPGKNGLTAGQVLTVPLRVTYRSTIDSNVKEIATNLFGEPQKAALLRDYNFLTSDKVAQGTTISIPIFLRIQAAKRRPQDDASTERAQKRQHLMEQAQMALPVAKAAWRRGDYSLVKRELSEVARNSAYLDLDLATNIGVLLGSAYVAYRDTDTAMSYFQQVLERDPDHRLSSYYYSPTICAAWKSAGGQIDE